MVKKSDYLGLYKEIFNVPSIKIDDYLYRSFVTGIKTLDFLDSDLNLDQESKMRVIRFYSNVLKSKGDRIFSYHILIASCIYLITHYSGVDDPIRLRDIIKSYEKRNGRKITKMGFLKFSEKIKRDFKHLLVNKSVHSENYVDRIISKIIDHPEVVERLVERGIDWMTYRGDLVEETRFLLSKADLKERGSWSPFHFAVSCVYAADKILAYHKDRKKILTQSILSQITEITELTIRNHFSDLLHDLVEQRKDGIGVIEEKLQVPQPRKKKVKKEKRYSIDELIKKSLGEVLNDGINISRDVQLRFSYNDTDKLCVGCWEFVPAGEEVMTVIDSSFCVECRKKIFVDRYMKRKPHFKDKNEEKDYYNNCEDLLKKLDLSDYKFGLDFIRTKKELYNELSKIKAWRQYPIYDFFYEGVIDWEAEWVVEMLWKYREKNTRKITKIGKPTFALFVYYLGIFRLSRNYDVPQSILMSHFGIDNIRYRYLYNKMHLIFG